MEIVNISHAKKHHGLRLVTRPGVPTPWAQAAKGIIELKKIPCVLAQESCDDAKGAHRQWTGDGGAPHVAYGEEAIRSGWAQILELAERIAPEPTLIPTEGSSRAQMFGLANEICGEMGLGWSLRLIMVHKSLTEPEVEGAFPERVATYLATKYGYNPISVAQAPKRVRSIIATLSAALGDKSYFFENLSALDVYWATFGNMFLLLDDQELPAVPLARKAWAMGGGAFRDELPKNLVAHHRKMYDKHLGLPVQL